MSRQSAQSKSIERLRCEIIAEHGEAILQKAEAEINSCILDKSGNRNAKYLAGYFWTGAGQQFAMPIRNYGRLVISLDYENGDE